MGKAPPRNTASDLRGTGNRSAQRGGRKDEGHAPAAQPHGYGEGIAGSHQMVAEHAVQRRQHCLAPGRRGFLRQSRRELSEGQVQAAADHMGDSADGAVDQARNPAHRRALDGTQGTGGAGDVVEIGRAHV